MSQSHMTPVAGSLTHLESSSSCLNEAQHYATENLEGPVLVLAGAGTGKTRVLTTRIANVLKRQLAWPSQILSVTFTNKAALEMRQRVEQMMENPVEGLWLGTFHSLCARILRRHAELVNRTPDFTILDTDDQLRLIKQISKAEDVDDKKLPPRVISAVIGRWKDKGLTPNKVPNAKFDQILQVYEIYQERLQTLNAVDFGDLLLLCLELFSQHLDVLQIYQDRFRYLLVDEYQDTNVAQYLWLRLLTQKNQNLCCVGDDDQSIYGWRGAEVTNILKFEHDFPNAKIIRLEQNYRSSHHILGAASGLIAHNQGRLGKTLWTDQEESKGEKVQVCGVSDGAEEAQLVGEEIESLQRQGIQLSDMAILVRATFQTREFEERFIRLGIAYRVIGGARFYERREIRDAMAYLRIVAQPHDSLAFERVLNVPRRGLGESTLQKLHICAREQKIPLLKAAIQLIQTNSIKGKACTSLTQFIQDIERWHRQVLQKKPSELVQIILDESGYTAMWLNDKAPDAPGRLENLKELVRALNDYKSLTAFLEHVSLVMENNQAHHSDSVNLMTMHGAKGLEFDTVFLAGWEEGLFPHSRALADSNNRGLEEERRLAYVGLTRAKRQAFITFAGMRRIHGKWKTALPSRFLSELPKAHVEVRHKYFQSQSLQAQHNRYVQVDPVHHFDDYSQDPWDQ
ncbi:MAG: UvrD-helicase domain-containing protein [Pseudomonadota bacterium]